MQNKNEKQLKVCLLGDQSVGKTCIARRFVQNVFSNTDPTVGASYMSNTLTVDKTDYKIQMWDTAGQEQFRNLAPMYYRGAAASLLVFDITSDVTFVSLSNWMAELKEMASSDMLLVVAGNKSDLRSIRKKIQKHHSMVTEDEISHFMEEHELKYFDCSAKTGENIEEIFRYICRHTPEKLMKTTRPPEHIILSDELPDMDRKKPCC